MPGKNRKSQPLPTLAEIEDELLRVARAGELFTDGALCRRAFRPYADRYLDSDDLDLEPEACVPLKKTLIRLQRLSRVPCSTALYRRRPDMPDRYETFLLGFCGSPATTPIPAWGRKDYRPPKLRSLPELAAAFAGRTGSRRTPGIASSHPLILRRRGVPARGVRGNVMVQVFAPVKDSLGEVTAVIEIFAAAVGR